MYFERRRLRNGLLGYMKMKIIQIDGKDGGGQILRSALSLSLVTGRGFRISNIRGKRPKSGLMRQHLTCVKAAAEVSDAAVDGAEMFSTELVFQPNKVKAGDYVFNIGSAGSTTLLFQTLLPALILLDDPSTVQVHGGTHNPMAPSADFIERAFLPQMADAGVRVDFKCERLGFAPAGGGCIKATVHPCSRLKQLSLLDRGALVSEKAQSLLANVRESVAERQLKIAKKVLGWDDSNVETITTDQVDGSGNAFFIESAFENVVQHVTCLGAFGKGSEKVVGTAIKELETYLHSPAVVGVRLADQLLLPMALAGGGAIKTQFISNHIKTNIRTIEQFLDVAFTTEQEEAGAVVIKAEKKKE